jgi:hypothetical protein
MLPKDFEKNIDKLIKKRIEKHKRTVIYEDVVLCDFINGNKEIIDKAQKLKEIQMIVGSVWQKNNRID